MRRPDFDDPDLPLSELFAAWPLAAKAFWDRRMLCPGCPIGPFHTITDACQEYGLDETAFREELAVLIRASARD
jgi:hybrid cluster-associated redox disulfide protein